MYENLTINDSNLSSLRINLQAVDFQDTCVAACGSGGLWYVVYNIQIVFQFVKTEQFNTAL